ncbi:MAG: tRNA dihydrouridine synthase DusB [Deltaproteobacteria bacterium]|nr:tRNA dihydrouridine synthase DusB [Deltaproteobacteria bacterium]
MTVSFPSPLRIGALRLASPLLLAPLAGISDLPFRLLAREQGCALVFTEMISAEGIVRKHKKTSRFLQSSPEERPLAVQLFGDRSEVLAEAASIVEQMGADGVDINMGCPVRKVVGGGSGAALLKDPARIEEIIRAVRRRITVPLTIKIRSGWDEKGKNFLEIGKIAEGAGVDALILHGRTRSQNYGMKADWEVIRLAREHLGIPVIGNGDMLAPQAIVNFFDQTSCPGAMIGRGSLGNPWIFRSALQLLRGEPLGEPSLEEKEGTILRHLHMAAELHGEVLTAKEFRKHLIWYTRGLRGCVDLRVRIPGWQTIAEMVRGIQDFFYGLKNSLALS